MKCALIEQRAHKLPSSESFRTKENINIETDSQNSTVNNNRTKESSELILFN